MANQFQSKRPPLPLLLALPLAVFPSFFLASCSTQKNIDIAKAATEQFHNAMNAGAYPKIFAMGTAEFRNNQTEAEITELISAVHRKLGDFKSTSNQGFHVNWNTNGTFVTLTYESQYAEGKATEAFVWRIQDDAPQLHSFNINSPLLITR